MPQPLTQQQNEERQLPPQRVVGGTTPNLAFSIDPASGRLYISNEVSDIRLRDDGSGRLAPSDDTTDPAAKMALVNSASRITVYQAT